MVRIPYFDGEVYERGTGSSYANITAQYATDSVVTQETMSPMFILKPMHDGDVLRAIQFARKAHIDDDFLQL